MPAPPTLAIGCQQMAIMVLTACLLPLTLSAAEPEQTVTLENVFDAWKAREKAVRQAKFLWTLTRLEMQGAFVGKNDRPRDDQGKTFPPEDTIYRANYQFWLDGDHWRYDRRGLVWYSPVEQDVAAHNVKLFDGSKYIDFFGIPSVEGASFATLDEYPRNRTRDPPVWPLMNALRPLHPAIGDFSDFEWKLLEKREIVASHECLVMEKIEHSASKFSLRYFVDPERGYVILRRLRASTDRSVQLDIRYAADPIAGWVPQSWLGIHKGPSNSGETITNYRIEGTVKSYQLNRQFEQSPFDFEFPTGTDIRDGGRRR